MDIGRLPTLVLNDAPIEFVDRVKYLGVILDSKLSLVSHVEYVKSRAQKRISILKSISGKSYGADRTVLLRTYKSLIRPILEYSSFILDGPGNRHVQSLEVIQNTSLRIASGALRTSPIRALQVDTNTVPLSLRRRELLVRYYLKVKSDRQHPCHHAIDPLSYEEVYRGLSERYLKRISGFHISYRLKDIFQEMQFDPPEQMVCERQTVAPWLLDNVKTIMLLTQGKRHMTDLEIQAEFHELTDRYHGYRLLFTDGSKQDMSAACAFTVNNAFFAYKLQDGVSVYTAELVAIREALKFVRTNRVFKALICSDSQSAIRAMSSQNREHPVLIEILELYHKLLSDGVDCVMVWIPGHQGIAGNVRADYWARKAHERPEVTHVNVGYREYVPLVRTCIFNLFSKMWQDYRPTQLQQIKPVTGYWTSCVRDSRKEEVVLCRMRLGHTRLTHSHLIDQQDPIECDLCHCRQDVKHLLLDCRRYTVARRKLSLACRNVGIALRMDTLLGNNVKSVLDAIFDFLRESDIYDKM